MRPALAALACLLWVDAALALSCMRPDVARSYQAAAEARESYVVVLGRLEFDTARLPRSGENGAPAHSHIPARVTGKGLTLAGFETPFRTGITLDAQCLGPWCAAPPSGRKAMMFLRKGPGGYLLEEGPCGGHIFAEPTPGQIERVLRCHRGGPCKAARRR